MSAPNPRLVALLSEHMPEWRGHRGVVGVAWCCTCGAFWSRHYAEFLQHLAAEVEAHVQERIAEAQRKHALPKSPFENVPSGIDIAHYFWEETEHENPGCDGIDLYRDGTDYCYLWVEAMVDHDMWVAYLLDIRTHVGGDPSAFDETRDYLFLMVGAGGMFDVEWHNQPIRFDAPADDHWERFQRGLKWLGNLSEKSIEDHGDRAAAHRPEGGSDE